MLNKVRFSEIATHKNLIVSESFFRWNKKLNQNKWFLGDRLVEYFDIISGFAFKSTNYTEEGISVMRIGDILKDGSLDTDNMNSLPDDFFDIYSKYLVVENDIAIAMTGATIGKTTHISNIPNPILLNQRVGLLRIKKGIKLNTKFIQLLLRNELFQIQILINSMGKSQPNISPFDILDLKIPRLTIKIQNDIISKIQPIENEITKLKNSKLKPLDIINKVFGEEFGFDWDYYKDFGKGMTAGTQQSNIKEKLVYKVAFSKIQKSNIVRISSRFHNPKTQFLNDILFSKSNIKVKNIIKEIVKGVQPDYDTEGEVSVVKITNLKNGYIDLENPELVKQSFFDKLDTKRKLQKNDVIICCTGKVSLGKVDLYEIEDDAVLTVDNYLIRLNDNFNPLFFVYFFRSLLGVFQIERDYTGATNQIHLYEKQIIEFDFPNFSLAKQTQIVSKIKTKIDAQNSIDSQIEQKQQQINEIIENAIKTE